MSFLFDRGALGKLRIFLETILDYCKTELLPGRMINIPNLITNDVRFPLYGLHSTGYDSLKSIYENGFVPKNRWGISKDETIIAMFSAPFGDNYDKIGGVLPLNFNDGISLTIGISRALALEKKLKPEDINKQYLEFPIILACFTSSPTIITSVWVNAYDNKDIHIIGHFDIKIEKDANYNKYIDYRAVNKKKAEGKMYKLNIIIDKFNYSKAFWDNNTIPISYYNEIKNYTPDINFHIGGKNKRKTLCKKKSNNNNKTIKR